MSTAAVFVGIEVAKERLDVARRPTADRWGAPTMSRASPASVMRLQAVRPVLVVPGGHGGAWSSPSPGCCSRRGLPMVVVNPRQVWDFAKATGQLAKTDVLDAATLAPFAVALRPAVRPLPDVDTQALGTLLTRWRQLLEMRTTRRTALSRII